MIGLQYVIGPQYVIGRQYTVGLQDMVSVHLFTSLDVVLGLSQYYMLPTAIDSTRPRAEFCV